MQLSHIAHVCIAYFMHASGMILYAMAIEHVEFRDTLQTLIDCAHEQDGNIHDSWQNGDAFTSAAIQGGLSTRTYAYTIIYVTPGYTADQYDRELVPSLSHHNPLFTQSSRLVR